MIRFLVILRTTQTLNIAFPMAKIHPLFLGSAVRKQGAPSSISASIRLHIFASCKKICRSKSESHRDIHVKWRIMPTRHVGSSISEDSDAMMSNLVSNLSCSRPCRCSFVLHVAGANRRWILSGRERIDGLDTRGCDTHGGQTYRCSLFIYKSSLCPPHYDTVLETRSGCNW